MLKFLNSNSKNFEVKLKYILGKRKFLQNSNSKSVKKIIKNVMSFGDKTLIQYEKKFSNIKSKNVRIKFSKKEINNISKKVDLDLKRSIDTAFNRIYKFHSKQKTNFINFKDKYNNKLSYIYSPIESIGVYVPGGTASYPSTVLMNCIPAIVAGVKQIYLTVPCM